MAILSSLRTMGNNLMIALHFLMSIQLKRVGGDFNEA